MSTLETTNAQMGRKSLAWKHRERNTRRSLVRRLHTKCIPPGGEKLRFDGTSWISVCTSGWKGSTCEELLSVESLWSSQESMNITENKLDFGGSSVALDGDTAMIGVPSDYSSKGSIYVPVRSGTTSWT